MTRPLDPAALTRALAAFCDVPVAKLTLDDRTGSLRRAVARAIHEYIDATAEAKRDAA